MARINIGEGASWASISKSLSTNGRDKMKSQDVSTYTHIRRNSKWIQEVKDLAAEKLDEL